MQPLSKNKLDSAASCSSEQLKNEARKLTANNSATGWVGKDGDGIARNRRFTDLDY